MVDWECSSNRLVDQHGKVGNRTNGDQNRLKEASEFVHFFLALVTGDIGALASLSAFAGFRSIRPDRSQCFLQTARVHGFPASFNCSAGWHCITEYACCLSDAPYLRNAPPVPRLPNDSSLALCRAGVPREGCFLSWELDRHRLRFVHSTLTVDARYDA